MFGEMVSTSSEQLDFCQLQLPPSNECHDNLPSSLGVATLDDILVDHCVLQETTAHNEVTPHSTYIGRL